MTEIIAYLLNSDIAQTIGGLLILFIGALGYGKLQKRKGRKLAEAKQAEKEINEYVETTKRLGPIDTPVDAASARERLRAANAKLAKGRDR